MKKLLVVLLALSGVTGCAPSNPEGTGTEVAGTVDNPETAPGAASESGDSGTRGNPIAIRTKAKVGDEWEVGVVSAEADAAAKIAAENQFNDAPAPGENFVLVRIQATYSGSESGTAWLDLAWKVLGPNGNTFSDSCGVTPDDLSDKGEQFSGATTEGNVCLKVPTDQVSGALLIVEESFSFDATRVFYSLA